MTPAAPSRRSFASFNGDFDELAALMNLSWGENQEQPLRSTSDFLRSAFEYPGAGFELAPAVYRDGRLVAFVAGFPRTVRIAGETKPLLSVSFLTVSPEHKRAGYGPLMWGELLRRARERGFAGALDFTVEGDPWSRQILAVARMLRQPTAQIFSVSFMARLLRGNETAATQTGEVDAAGALLEAATCIGNDVPLLRLWTQAEAEWQCRRAGAINATVVRDSRSGILTGYAVETAGTAPMLSVILDDILWGNLEAGERAEVVQSFLAKAAGIGARIVITPVLGYADMQPLAAAGFRKTRRLLHAYLTSWETPVPEDMSAIYIDVF